MTSKPIVLIGLPGSGKSTVAKNLAASLGRSAVDLDRLIADTDGRSVEEIFSENGEAYFRKLESQVLASAIEINPGAVIAGGGGLLETIENAELLRATSTTVWLNPPLAEICRRLDADTTVRPLLTTTSIETLSADRLGAYSIAADYVVTRVAEPAQLAEEIVERLLVEPTTRRVERVEVPGGRSYDVVVGRGVSQELADLIPPHAKRVAIVTQDGIDIDLDPGVEFKRFVVEPGEQAKRLDVAGDLASSFAEWGLTRGDAVVSIGGGVVSDLAGFVAASYHRGVPVVHVSTTLLGQIDAAIGGKTGVNLPEGKNLFGAFWQPHAVICDVDHLRTLPPREFRSGMGELAKYHFLGGGDLDLLPMVDRVAACVRIKADLVAADEREGGRRAILNYGHTLAHALETSGRYGLRHGEAVAIGLIYAGELGRRLGRIDQASVDEHRRIVSAYSLQTTLPEGAVAADLLSLFKRDKKAVNGITFVLSGENGVEPVEIDDEGVLLDALEAVRP